MKMKSLFFAIAVMLTTSEAFAHALWIQTVSTGKQGEPIQVNVFFGEYADNKPDSTARWFSNLNRFKLMLTTPDGKTQVLATKADVFSHVALFTPQQVGVYTLSIVHHVANLHRKAKIEFYAFTNVSIGAEKNDSFVPEYALLAFKVSKNLAYTIGYKQKAFAEKKIYVFNPSFEKTETYTNIEGGFNFNPSQKGAYFLIATEEEKTRGKLKGISYKKIWHVATYYTQTY